MAKLRTATAGGVFEPEHLKILQGFSIKHAAIEGIFHQSLEAEELALQVIRLFQAGIVSEVDLRDVLARSKN